MRISEDAEPSTDEDTRSHSRGNSSLAQAREVLELRAFRRLWVVTGLCSTADWLALAGLAALASTLATSAAGLNFAFSGVLFANLLPGLLFAPIAGLIADRFDRRTVMAAADLARCALLLSIAVVNTYWWILAGGFLVQIATTMWIPAKDAALPRLLRRPDQVASAAQLGLVMTYGITVVVAGALYTLITGAGTVFGLPTEVIAMNGLTRLAIALAALLDLASAASITALVPELSGRFAQATPSTPDASTPMAATEPGPGVAGMLRDSVSYLRRTPLVRGLLVGMAGALTAGGAVVGSAQPYALSLLGGQAAFGLLLLSAFLGLVIGIVATPRLAGRMTHERLFGIAVVAAGSMLVLLALSPHLAVSLPTVVVVGACAGTAFLAGVTIIGSRVDDALRGRVNALYQSLLKVVLGCSVALSPLLVTLIGQRQVLLWGNDLLIDATRPVILGGGLLAVVAGTIACRHMRDDARRPVACRPGVSDAARR
ncbi:MFS transporter [Plantactinospora sp. KLBMP9567]|uniref:MFS transporter n=1 Tax=Plantactinospora sp. KLBMP9567 TaxID=3085900 RepID=UPI0029825C76|nr:MFS transporter [Plantactinospora sp. KLBMP9567]MDW5326526.1 MFS transporter [Plantactinospora sp. KLBMP9567]